MGTNLFHVLTSVGFNDKEAKLYLIGLKIGSAPASDFAKRTGLNRVTAYNVLEHLVKQGYFTVEKRERVKFYVPVEPEYVLEESRKNMEALHRSIPELRSLRGSKHRQPHVRFFEGWEGVRHVYEDTLTAEGELLNFANSAVIRDKWPDYDDEYVNRRKEKKIFLRGIAPDDLAGHIVQKKDKNCFREIRLVSNDEFDFKNEINIYDHKVAIVSFGATEDEVFGVIIESKEVAETQKQIFEMAWRFAHSAK